MEASTLIYLETKNLWPGMLGKLDNIDFMFLNTFYYLF